MTVPLKPIIGSSYESTNRKRGKSPATFSSHFTGGDQAVSKRYTRKSGASWSFAWTSHLVPQCAIHQWYQFVAPYFFCMAFSSSVGIATGLPFISRHTLTYTPSITFPPETVFLISSGTGYKLSRDKSVFVIPSWGFANFLNRWTTFSPPSTVRMFSHQFGT